MRIMYNHLKNYIGIYLLAMVALSIYFDTPDDNYPVWVWWLMVPVILWKAPPFNIGDWFWGKIASFFMWISGPWRKWQATWPTWAKYVFAIIAIILFEEYILKPAGYTMYPWRMDFQ